MTYVAQFLQYSKEMPVSEEEMQVCLLCHGNKKYIPYSLEPPLPHSIVVLSAFNHSPISISVQTHYLTTPKCLSPISLPTHFTPAVGASPLRQVDHLHEGCFATECHVALDTHDIQYSICAKALLFLWG